MTHFCVCTHVETETDDSFKFRAKKGDNNCDSALFVQTVPKSVGETINDRVAAAWEIVKPRAAEWSDKQSEMPMTGPLSMESLALASLDAESLASFEAEIVRMEMYPKEGPPTTWVMSVNLTHIPSMKQKIVEYTQQINQDADTCCMEVKPDLLKGCADLLNEWAGSKIQDEPVMQFIPLL